MKKLFLLLPVLLIACSSVASKDPVEIIATEYVKTHSVAGLQFKLVSIRNTEAWRIYKVIPLNIETDTAQLYLKKVNNKWTAVRFGTE